MKNYFLLLLNFLTLTVLAQNSIQPTVMVIPFARADQDLREVYEHQNSGPVRAVISKVKDQLDQEGIRTTDFRAILKQLKNTEVFTSGQQTSVKQRVIELSAADIYLESETQIVRTPTGNSVTVILTAYDAFTGRSLVNKLGHSPKFYTENFEKLAEKALDNFLKAFTQSLKNELENMLLNGRSIAMDIGIAEGAEIDMDFVMENFQGILLSDAIEGWLEENALNAYFHIQGITATKMIIDEVKIPMIDSATQKNYRPSKFAALLRKFLQSRGFEVTRDVQGGKIFITINNLAKN